MMQGCKPLIPRKSPSCSTQSSFLLQLNAVTIPSHGSLSGTALMVTRWESSADAAVVNEALLAVHMLGLFLYL